MVVRPIWGSATLTGMDATLFEMIDATGGGCCRLQTDDTIVAASPNFVALTGVVEPVGRKPAELIAELPPLGGLPPTVGAEPVIVRVVGRDGIGRELAVARVPGADGGMLLVVDRSGEARLRRTEVRLSRQIDDLEAELAARERVPKRRIRSLAELTLRLHEALQRARHYHHNVTLLVIRITGEGPIGVAERTVGETIVGCVRGVDDLGCAEDGRWILLLPHTDLTGGEIVAKRIIAKLETLAIGRVALGVAQANADEPGSSVVERAERVCAQALESGGGLLLAVALV
jgi:hypothetical protein